GHASSQEDWSGTGAACPPSSANSIRLSSWWEKLVDVISPHRASPDRVFARPEFRGIEFHRLRCLRAQQPGFRAQLPARDGRADCLKAAVRQLAARLLLLQVRKRRKDLFAMRDRFYSGEHLRDLALRIDDEGITLRELVAVVFHHRAVHL